MILDHADDNGWAIMATPNGHYVWLMSRRPILEDIDFRVAPGETVAIDSPVSAAIARTVTRPVSETGSETDSCFIDSP